MSLRPAAAAVAVALVALGAACGGGGGGGATTTSAPPSTEESTTTSVEVTTTTLGIDPALQELLLVAEDVPNFKEKDPPVSVNPSAEDDDALQKCEAQVPELKDAADTPEIEGSTFVRGADDAVEVSSSVSDGDPAEAQALLDALLDGKLTACLEESFKAGVGPDAPAGVDVTFKTTQTKATVAGADQTVVLSSAFGVSGGGVKLSFRLDIVLLRQEGTVVSIFYFGPSNITSSAERQRLVAAVSKKLQGTSSSSSSTSSTSKSSSTTRRATSTTRRSTSTTRQASTTSSSSSSGSSSTSSTTL